jgi:hypothetical protein
VRIEQAIIRPPEYGSAEWHALPTDDPRRQAGLVHAADSWAVLVSSPHVADVLFEYREWLRRANFRDISSAISAAADWRGLAGQPTFAELERRRSTYTTPALTPAQIRAKAAASWDELEARYGVRKAA